MPRVGSHLINAPSPQVYNGLDCALTYEVHQKLAEIPDDGVIYKFSRALMAPVLEMMMRGITVDPFARELALESLKLKLDALDRMLEVWIGAITDKKLLRKTTGEFRGELTIPNSPKQLMELFYERMGIKRIGSWSNGEMNYSMDRETLEKIADHYYARPIVNAILLTRDLRKEREILTKEIDPDWRWRQSINIAGTKTGRFSSSKSTTGTGSNTQNISVDLRHVFIASPGHKLFAIDKEQAEAREVGWLCGTLFDDWSYLDACEGADLHTTICRMVWENDLPWTGDMKKDRKIAEEGIFYRHYTYRDTVKRLGHGSCYGGLPPTLSSHTNIPVSMCASFQDRFFTRFPGIPRYHQYIAQELQTKGYLVNRFGRRRDFFDRVREREVINSGIAYLPQSATADDLNLGLYRLWKHMGTRIQLLHQWHDAIYAEYREDDDEEDVLRQAMQHMDVVMYAPNGRRFSVPVEAKVGWNFGPRYKQDAEGKYLDVNPKGLDKFKFTVGSIY